MKRENGQRRYKKEGIGWERVRKFKKTEKKVKEEVLRGEGRRKKDRERGKRKAKRKRRKGNKEIERRERGKWTKNTFEKRHGE